MEHVDFMDYVYSSKNVSYPNFTYARMVGGIMNWLSNLAQSNRQIDISHDWVVVLQVLQIEEVLRGFGKKRKLNEENGNDVDNCQFPAIVEACHNKAAKTDIGSCMPMQEGSPVFNPSYVLDIQHKKEKEDKEYTSFGIHLIHQHPAQNQTVMTTKTTKWMMTEALNFFVSNETNNSENVVDYFDKETFNGTIIDFNVFTLHIPNTV